MTDEELIAQLRDSKGWPNLGNAAADRVSTLIEEKNAQKARADRLEVLLREAKRELHRTLYENMWTKRMELCRRIDAELKG